MGADDRIERSDRDRIKASVTKLLTNWGKSASGRQIDLWTDNAVEDGFTPDDVERGVRACIRGWTEPNAPQGWANFARFLPSPRVVAAPPALPWFGSEDGAWGGDWADVPMRRWLAVAATFEAIRPFLGESGHRSAAAFLALARRRIPQADIEAAAAAQRSGHLAAFVGAWWASRQMRRAAQEPLNV